MITVLGRVLLMKSASGLTVVRRKH